jgi:hypothetical protein
MKIMVTVEVEVEGNDHPREWVEQCLEDAIDRNENIINEWRYCKNAKDTIHEVQVVSIRVVFPENT